MARAFTALLATVGRAGSITKSELPSSVHPYLLKLHLRGVELRVPDQICITSAEVALPVPEDNAVDRPLLRVFAPLHRGALGTACGVVVGGLICAATLTLVIHGGFPNIKLYLLAQFFWGYSVSWLGALIGFLWGWVIGFVLGYGFALVRNAVVWMWLTVIRSRAEMEQYSDFLDHL
jgi:hypothetical protein